LVQLQGAIDTLPAKEASARAELEAALKEYHQCVL
jgi:hypothetical protein